MTDFQPIPDLIPFRGMQHVLMDYVDERRVLIPIVD